MFRSWCVVACIVFSMGSALAQNTNVASSPEAHQEAKLLLDTMHMGKSMNSAMQGMLQTQLASNPKMLQFKDDLELFINKHASYEALYPDLLELYAQTYSVEEMRELTRFYKSPIGQRTIELMPELMIRAQQMGVKRVEDNKAELVEMVIKRMSSSKP